MRSVAKLFASPPAWILPTRKGVPKFEDILYHVTLSVATLAPHAVQVRVSQKFELLGSNFWGFFGRGAGSATRSE